MPALRVLLSLRRRLVAAGWIVLAALPAAAADAGYDPAPWAAALAAGTAPAELQRGFPVEWDWLHQDDDPASLRQLAAGQAPAIGRDQTEAVAASLTNKAAPLRAEMEALFLQNVAAGDPRWLILHARACEQRRAQRLAGLLDKRPAIAFIKRKTLRPSFFAYTEAQSDAQSERNFLPGATLCRLRFNGTRGIVDPLLDDPTGMLRDPAVSWDARRLAFAWKKSLNEDDYHLYEMEQAWGGASSPRAWEWRIMSRRTCLTTT